MKLISVVLPCHNEAKNLPSLIKEITRFIPKKYSLEIICVDDGSRDNTADTILELAKKNKRVKGILLYRNFGHQAALRAGIKSATGDAIITMDSDFQHPPSILPLLIKDWEKGHDLVKTKKKEDKTASLVMKLQRKVGYKVWEMMTDGLIMPGGSDFRLMSKPIANYITKTKEREILLRGNVMLAAKNPSIVLYKVGSRKFGKSSYSFNMFINMFLNGFISFSTKPLRIASITGLILFLVSAFILFADIAIALVSQKQIIEGWVTAIMLMVLLNGILMMYLGLLGEYISVIFKEVKQRPTYLIKQKVNLK